MIMMMIMRMKQRDSDDRDKEIIGSDSNSERYTKELLPQLQQKRLVGFDFLLQLHHTVQ